MASSCQGLWGIYQFIDKTPCLAVVAVERLPDAAAALPSKTELARLARSAPGQPERAVAVIVRELGARLTIEIPEIVEGETEVLLEISVLHTRTGKTLAGSRTLWRNGGAFVIKGVKTLDQDMSAD